MDNKENSGSTGKDGESFEYLELEYLPNSSVVAHSSGEAGKTISETISGVDTSTPIRELRRSSREPEANLKYLSSLHYLLLIDNGETKKL